MRTHKTKEEKGSEYMKLRRIGVLLLCLCLFMPLARASETLPAAATREEVEAFIDFGLTDEEAVPSPKGVEAGAIRYIAQKEKDPTFVKAYWLGGKENSELDLTRRKDRTGEEYRFYCGNMCTRATFSMALSYLGVDCTPGAMSALLERRNIATPYDEITATLDGLQRVTHQTYPFDQMYASYEADAHYSPVYLYCRKPNGDTHALLVVARTEKTNGFWVIDPAIQKVGGEATHVFRIRLNSTKRKILAASPCDYKDSRVLYCCQWRLTEE